LAFARLMGQESFRPEDTLRHLGMDFYRFVGCFKLNADRSIKEGQLVWERFADTYTLRG